MENQISADLSLRGDELVATLIKRAFGLVAIALGLWMLVVLGQSRLKTTNPIGWLPLTVLIAVSCSFVYFGWNWLLNVIGLEAIPVDPGSPEIAEAKRRAHGSLDRFWAYLAANTHECFIKFPMQTRAGHLEHIWAVVHSRTEDGVVVSLANDPVDGPVDESARRVVSVSDIEDWQVAVSKSEIRGGYSVGALMQIAKARGHRLSMSARRRLRAFVDVV